MSQQFAQPGYQSSLSAPVQQILNGHRGIPDVAYNADGSTSILIYLSFLGPSASSRLKNEDWGFYKTIEARGDACDRTSGERSL